MQASMMVKLMNALAHYGIGSITTVKSFIIQTIRMVKLMNALAHNSMKLIIALKSSSTGLYDGEIYDRTCLLWHRIDYDHEEFYNTDPLDRFGSKNSVLMPEGRAKSITHSDELFIKIRLDFKNYSYELLTIRPIPLASRRLAVSSTSSTAVF